MLAVETHNLTKIYTQTKKQPGIKGALKGLFSREKTLIEAVKGVNLQIEQGELVGFLGPNGAGKTTTLKMLTGILYPTSGEALVLGHRPFDRKPQMMRNISLVMGNKMQLWWDLPAWDSFIVLRELYEVDHQVFQKRIDHLLEALQLTDKVHTQVRKLSLGERMKCELVAALLHAPRVIFLDEPTIGLDVVSQKRIRDFLLDLHKQEGCTILLTSHYMLDVQELCDRVLVIDHGELVFEGGLDQLANQYSSVRRLRLVFEHDVTDEDLAPYGAVLERNEESVTLSVPKEQTAAVTGQILQKFAVRDVGIEDPSIEEVVRDLFSQR